MKIIVSHSGKQHSYHLAYALQQQGVLEKFYTSGYLRNKYLQNKVLASGNTFWSRRFLDGLYGSMVDSNWRFEFPEYLLRLKEGKSENVQKAVYRRDVSFDKYIARKIKTSDSDVFWGFQGSCHDSLTIAKSKGITAVCELATAHVVEAKKILGEEARLHPEWADSIDNLVFPSDYEKRLEEEAQIADYVIAASDFTKQSLLNSGIDQGKILKLPLGFDLSYVPYSKTFESASIENRPLKLLYAGTVTQRKGIKYLLEAMKAFSSKDVELHIIGGIQGSGEAFAQYSNYIYHAPVSQYELFQMYSQYDVLILPSVFEGFGLVIAEAMAAGLPVIATPNTFGPEIVNNGENGFIVSVRDVKAIETSIAFFRNCTNVQFYGFVEKANQFAQNYSWSAYQKRLQSLLKFLH